MNKKIPYTPFSTRLSGSARETENRLKNIFSGPKKRPPALLLALVFSVCVLCGNLVSCQNAEAESQLSTIREESVPPTEAWVDYWIIPWNVPWENSGETIELPEYPGVTFYWTPSTVSAMKDGETTELFRGMPIWNVFLCDLSGDGLRELCATVSYGSGLIDDHVVVYDYAAGAVYTLWDRGIQDYVLFLEDGRLQVTRAHYNGPVISAGGLAVTEDGALKMTDEVPVTDTLVRPHGPDSDSGTGAWTAIEPDPSKLPIDESLKLWFGSGAGGWATISDPERSRYERKNTLHPILHPPVRFGQRDGGSPEKYLLRA